MIKLLKTIVAVSIGACAFQASADVTFYEHDDFEGRAFTPRGRVVENFHHAGFNDRASSVVVEDGPWEVCEHVEFEGRCIILRPGSYPSLRSMGLNDRLSSARAVRSGRPRDRERYAPSPLPAQISFFERDGFRGRDFSTQDDVPNFQRYGFNDRASSVIVQGGRWEACEHVGFSGRCVILRPGSYPNLDAMGLNNHLSSVRRVHPGARFDDSRYAPPPAPAYDWRRRPEERLYQARVISVRAMFAAPQQHCWVEREQVVQEQAREPNVRGAVIGGIIGGILGHQIGRGSERDVATAGGAVAGAAIGSQVGGRQGQAVVSSRDVQRCTTVPGSSRPEYWDVIYRFRGAEHHMQTTSPPGPTVTVNDHGEPRL
jgi:uncharacterized protein YcfJ